MKINLMNGLPIVSLLLTYNHKFITLDNVLLDTGCSITIFDTDSVEPIGLDPDFINGKSVRMYGVGGQSELCYQQRIQNLKVNHIFLESFTIQLGLTREPYGFDAILGVDILSSFGLKIDFENLIVF
ncbi:aspartyl protease family protein [Paenibacillus sp. SYP-B4298]|uniref:aspartyl protease family protein n=1 Tax=Paenibacillus sp. SYP-B4298 TaxID=2996034 RepID=UPI0022DD2B0A|nr:aspartyl protease family protein [Paenibacillus sp. SYP-B4298]